VRPTSKTALPLNKWTHAAFVVDRAARRVRIFTDGAPDGETPIPPELTAPLDVEGRDLAVPSQHKPFVGLVDELRIYHRALPADEVARIHAEEVGGGTRAAE
jgi:hypothetical protein